MVYFDKQRLLTPSHECQIELTKVWALGQLQDLHLVLLGQLVGCKLLLLLAHMIGLKQGGEDWEAISCIQARIIAVCVDACTSPWCLSWEGGE